LAAKEMECLLKVFVSLGVFPVVEDKFLRDKFASCWVVVWSYPLKNARKLLEFRLGQEALFPVKR
jgi:hypothetical protein